jgi:integrase
MSVLFNHARRHGLFDSNPITLVRQSSKRRKIPHILTVDEIRRLLAVLRPLYRVLTFTDATTGLRQSELFGLKWSDVDFESGQINVVRSVVHGIVSPCKTESSLKPIPMAPELASLLREWKHRSRYTAPDDWVFASERSRGKHPMWGGNMIRKLIRRAARSLDIPETFGWHTFRHSYSIMLRLLGVDIKVQQDLLRQLIGQTHAGYLHAVGYSCKEGRTKQSCPITGWPRRNEPFWTRTMLLIEKDLGFVVAAVMRRDAPFCTCA